jgi:hypothetical protein
MYKILLSISLFFMGNLISGSALIPPPNRGVHIPVATQAPWVICGKHPDKKGFFHANQEQRDILEAAIRGLKFHPPGAVCDVEGVEVTREGPNIFSLNNTIKFICAEQGQLRTFVTEQRLGDLVLSSDRNNIRTQIEQLIRSAHPAVPLLPSSQPPARLPSPPSTLGAPSQSNTPSQAVTTIRRKNRSPFTSIN